MTENIEINQQLFINIDDNIYLSGQISTNAIEELKNKKFKIIVNNRPDDEEFNQLKSISLQKTSEKFGIVYKHIPFSGGNVNSDQIKDLADMLKKNTKTLIFCRSGARSSLIWGLASVIYLNKDIDDIMRKMSNMGYDSSILPNMVEYFLNS